MDSVEVALMVKARIYLNKDKYEIFSIESFNSVIILEKMKKIVNDKYNIKKNIKNLKIFVGNNRNENIECDDDIIKNSVDYEGNLLCYMDIILYEEQKENLNKNKKKEKEKLEIYNSKDILEENKKLKEEIEKLKKEKEIIENQKYNILKKFNGLKEKYKKELIDSKNELKNEMEGIITVIFISYDESILCSVPCKSTYKFYFVVNKFCEMNPEYKEIKNYAFYINGIKINKNKSLEENRIYNNSLITFKEK